MLVQAIHESAGGEALPPPPHRLILRRGEVGCASGRRKIAVWGSAFWGLRSLFPPKEQSIWGSNSGRGVPERPGAFWSVPERSDCQFRLQFGRFGGPISGREAAGPAGRPIWGCKSGQGVPGRSGASRGVPERSDHQVRLQFGRSDRAGRPANLGLYILVQAIHQSAGGEAL